MRSRKLIAAGLLASAVILGALAVVTQFRPAAVDRPQASGFVRVVVPSLSVRDSIGGEELDVVRDGERLFVVAGPHGSGTVAWYRIEYFSRNGSSPYALIRFGWVGLRVGQAAFATYEPDCPDVDQPLEIGDLASLNPAEVLHCIGDASIAIAPAIIRSESPEVFEEATPRWLAGQPALQIYGRNGWNSNDGSLGGHVPPGAPDPPVEQWLLVRGHFDDSGSAACRRTPLHREFGPMAEDAVLWCRQQFVIDTVAAVEAPEATPPLPETGGQWRRLPKGPLDGREGHSAVWTGTEMILWGGRTLQTHTAQKVEFAWESGGAAFDPVTREWRVISRAPIPGREGHAAVWTGMEMLIWGGSRADGRPLAGGGRYDPVADRWLAIPPAPLEDLEQLVVAQAIWTGDRLVAWSSTSVAAFDPVTNAWESLPPIPVPPPDGVALSDAGDALVALVYPTGISPRVQPYLFEDRGGDWQALPEPPLIALNSDRSPVWTGEDVLIFSYSDAEGVGDEVPPNTFYAARLSIEDATWTVDLAPQYFHHYPLRWGADAVYFPLGDGVFRNSTRSWQTLPPHPVEASEGFSLVWTGDSLIMWGGSAGESFLPLNEGWAFTPD